MSWKFLLIKNLGKRLTPVLLPLLLLGGCATTNPRDPLEPMNRAVYEFNDGIDKAILRPLAEGYRAVIPQFVRGNISNFFSNINDVLVCLNNLLQGKPVDALSDFGRVAFNSTFGLGGLLDIATPMGLEKHNEDFGQTLGRWGVGSGAYLVLPLLGPSTLRDTVGRAVEMKGDPLGYMNDIAWRNSLWGARLVSNRAELLDASRVLETAALDPYQFVRDAYLQRRRSLIYDGAPPREKDEDAKRRSKPDVFAAENPFPQAARDPQFMPGTPFLAMSGERQTDGLKPAIAPMQATPEHPAVTVKLAPSPSVTRIWLAPTHTD